MSSNISVYTPLNKMDDIQRQLHIYLKVTAIKIQVMKLFW